MVIESRGGEEVCECSQGSGHETSKLPRFLSREKSTTDVQLH